jgi:Cellulose binding domain
MARLHRNRRPDNRGRHTATPRPDGSDSPGGPARAYWDGDRDADHGAYAAYGVDPGTGQAYPEQPYPEQPFGEQPFAEGPFADKVYADQARTQRIPVDDQAYPDHDDHSRSRKRRRARTPHSPGAGRAGEGAGRDGNGAGREGNGAGRDGKQHSRLRSAGFLPAIMMAAVLTVGGGVAALAANNSGAGPSLSVSYQDVTGWGTGYTGQYTITNNGGAPTTGWTLGFKLPAGTTLTSLWNGTDTVSGGQVTVTNASWNAAIAPGGSAQVGFVTSDPGGSAADPTDCTIDGAACQAGGGGTPSPSPSQPAPTPTPTPAPTPAPTPSPSPSPSPAPPGGSAPASAAGFAPYVDTSLFPPFSLTTAANDTGVKQFNLAFVVSGGGCTPEWGGVTAIGSDPVASQISALRSMGGDARVSFGGEAGSELALTCTNASQLAAAYQQVISAYDLNKVDFDIEGAAIANTAANNVRDQALAQLQSQDKGLQVSFTLPVEPSGLTQDGINLLDGAVSAGVQISAVNVMAMDFGDANAPDPATMMGTYVVDSATATDAQLASVLGISDADAWAKVAVTPMIGQNDQSDEVFTLSDAQQLETFAASNHLAWLSMWSAGRDQQCPSAEGSAQATCSGVSQAQFAFMKILGQY